MEKKLLHKKALRKAIAIVGNQTKLAACIGVKQAYVWNWLNRDSTLPAEYAIPIEIATDGQVTRYDLRPDIFGAPPSEAAA